MSYNQELFDFLHNTFDVAALESEMQEIERIVGKRNKKQGNKPGGAHQLFARPGGTP